MAKKQLNNYLSSTIDLASQFEAIGQYRLWWLMIYSVICYYYLYIMCIVIKTYHNIGGVLVYLKTKYIDDIKFD